jgi:DNA-binding NarL/FixJ family response regulator
VRARVARQQLREALELARASGDDAVTVRAHEELVAAGARPPGPHREAHHPHRLRAARRAHGRRGNDQPPIAQAPFLTENTIETHLRSVFRKLEIRSRSQLARASGSPLLTENLTDAP